MKKSKKDKGSVGQDACQEKISSYHLRLFQGSKCDLITEDLPQH